MSVGQTIKKLRLQQGITQEELARCIGSTKQTIYKYEMGIVSNIPLSNLERIATVLKTTPAQLIGWQEDAPADLGASDLLEEIDLAFAGDYKELTEENKNVLRDMAKLLKDRQDRSQ